MALPGTSIEIEYTANGSLDTFAIPFAFQDSDQIYVTTEDPATEVVTVRVQGGTYDVVGTNVEFTVAPTASHLVRIYRLTPRTQTFDGQNSQPTLNETLETALDRIVMMIQEFEAEQTVGTIITSGGLAVQANQTVLADETITVGANYPRQLKRVQGDTAGTTAGAVTTIAAGATDGQELILEGLSDTDTLTILNGGNVLLSADAILANGDTLSLYWNSTRAKWVEHARSIA